MDLVGELYKRVYRMECTNEESAVLELKIERVIMDGEKDEEGDGEEEKALEVVKL